MKKLAILCNYKIFLFCFQVVKKVPVLAGVCATDPFRRMDYFLKQVESTGFSGLQNFPTVGLFDGNFRLNLEETGMGYRWVFGKEFLTISY